MRHPNYRLSFPQEGQFAAFCRYQSIGQWEIVDSGGSQTVEFDLEQIDNPITKEKPIEVETIHNRFTRTDCALFAIVVVKRGPPP